MSDGRGGFKGTDWTCVLQVIWVSTLMKERVAAEAVAQAAGRKNITFIMGLRSRRTKMATVRLAENAITKYMIPSRKRSFHSDDLSDIWRPIVERTNKMRLNPIAGEWEMSMHVL